MDAIKRCRARLTDTYPARTIYMPARRRTRATSSRNPGRHHLGMPGRLRRNPQATDTEQPSTGKRKSSSEWLAPEQAIAQIREIIRGFLARNRKHRKTIVAVQSAAGLGKTQTMDDEQLQAELREEERRAELAAYEDDD